MFKLTAKFNIYNHYIPIRLYVKYNDLKCLHFLKYFGSEII